MEGVRPDLTVDERRLLIAAYEASHPDWARVNVPIAKVGEDLGMEHQRARDAAFALQNYGYLELNSTGARFTLSGKKEAEHRIKERKASHKAKKALAVVGGYGLKKVDNLIWGVVGAALGIGGTLLTQYLKKKYHLE